MVDAQPDARMPSMELMPPSTAETGMVPSLVSSDER